MATFSRMFDLQMVLSGAAGLLLTILFVPPGKYSIDAVLFSIDPFYVFSVLFATVVCWSGWTIWELHSTTESQQQAKR